MPRDSATLAPKKPVQRSAEDLAQLADQLARPTQLRRADYQRFEPFVLKLKAAGWQGRQIFNQLLKLGEVKEVDRKNTEEAIYRMIRKAGL